MARIPLLDKDGAVRATTIVDFDDLMRFGHLRWHLDNRGYARRKEGPAKERRHVRLHRLILGLQPDDGLEGDHMNGDKLDNRRANLRIVPSGKNQQNRKKHKNNTSGFRGVSRCTKSGRWRAHVTVGGRQHEIGRFDTPEKASEAAIRFREQVMPFAVETGR